MKKKFKKLYEIDWSFKNIENAPINTILMTGYNERHTIKQLSEKWGFSDTIIIHDIRRI